MAICYAAKGEDDEVGRENNQEGEEGEGRREEGECRNFSRVLFARSNAEVINAEEERDGQLFSRLLPVAGGLPAANDEAEAETSVRVIDSDKLSCQSSQAA